VILRDYQSDGVDAVFERFNAGSKSTLVVMATGCGKTICFAHVAARWPEGNVLVLAHREELIFQARDKMQCVLGYAPAIEMGEYRADVDSPLFGSGPQAIVSSIQTLNAGRTCDACAGLGKVDRGDIELQACPACVDGMVRRMQRFRPDDFRLVIVDEAHHGCAETYRRVLRYFGRNPKCRTLGVTATPDRLDKLALGAIFESVAYEYNLPDAIDDGWLVDIEQRFIKCESLDFSRCRTTAGDLNGADLAAVLVEEEPLHQVVEPTIEIAGDRQTLVFAASVFHANRMAEIFNRLEPGSAECVDGSTPLWKRRDTLERFACRKFKRLVNCGVLLEGYDNKQIEVVAMGRPTKSRALYSQCIGRGTRPIVAPTEETPEARLAAIASSTKPNLLVLDFVGNSGRHKLISTADILGGTFEDHVVERAISRVREKGVGANMRAEMEAIVRDDKRKEKEREEEEERRAQVRAKVEFSQRAVDPFNVFDVTPHREPGWRKRRKPSPAQLAALERAGIPTEGISPGRASQLIDEIVKRRKAGLCTFKQARILAKNGLPTDLSFQDASAAITELAENSWRATDSLRERLNMEVVTEGAAL
jgi:superfamily II DNA or RNA helicase